MLEPHRCTLVDRRRWTREINWSRFTDSGLVSNNQRMAIRSRPTKHPSDEAVWQQEWLHQSRALSAISKMVSADKIYKSVRRGQTPWMNHKKMEDTEESRVPPLHSWSRVTLLVSDHRQHISRNNRVNNQRPDSSVSQINNNVTDQMRRVLIRLVRVVEQVSW